MSLPLVTMQPPSGQAPTQVHLPDGSLVTPNASGQVSVESRFVGVLINAGWSIVVPASTTHVP